MWKLSWTYRDRIIESVVAEHVRKNRKLAILGTMKVGRTTMASQYSKHLISVPQSGEKVDCDAVIMRPMSLFESYESNGEVSISSLFDGEPLPESSSDIGISQLCKIMYRGGWPVFIKNGIQYGKNTDEYLEEVGDLTIPKAVANNITKTVSFSEILRSTGRGAARVNADQRIKHLKDIMMVENIPSFDTSLRPRDKILTKEQWYFVDPSIYCVLMDALPFKMEKNMNVLYPAFFNLVVRDIRVYVTCLGGELFHYHTRSRFDAGIVIRLKGGRWALMGICSKADDIDDTASRMKSVLDAEPVIGEASFSMIVVPNGDAYVRDDGIFVIPVGCLRD